MLHRLCRYLRLQSLLNAAITAARESVRSMWSAPESCRTNSFREQDDPERGARDSESVPLFATVHSFPPEAASASYDTAGRDVLGVPR